MNIQNKDINPLSSVLDDYQQKVQHNEGPLSRDYNDNFEASSEYVETLPDLQNGEPSLIRGSKKQIQHVGISNFKMPLRYKSADGNLLTLETSVTGTVSLEANKKGINMSRIMRSFYKHSEDTFNFKVVENALSDYKEDLDSLDARIQIRFSFPMLKKSLRSSLEGFQYYNVALEVLDVENVCSNIVHLDYVYSSTCPCSLELSEHARSERGQLATPHSQRSIARISALVAPNKSFSIEEMILLCRKAIPTETQVMVKREDEQAFAELNASNPIFVEDAARLLCEQLQGFESVTDFRVVVNHQESLHSHDAVSVLINGPTFNQTSLDPTLFQSLHHTS
ncbi:MAG: GTP cyclohydrolase FolE2 [Paracoccaceae bacterium]|nr:MAG: GTP cyclohydrolase I FolE2 [Paracoccaceae bacterium]|tara:strand:- start:1105 stop:2118 length:1014 start_codon:yes stop_codon:yes gene_type:complete